ncbi:Solute-binding protein family 3 domain-containing protein, MltF-like [Desulfonema limicola]|uniref:Solute-binding protein family 3 domain-containing protein, MltF-like n=1 Tax=Desulfonema limicola TaxID=45656 RepID=A0A975B6U0_9BACT|nr:transporter substrate-binding domain-containing protein [Desulfonema limicola]QTA79868.1 Solute-binding protein family 3 domain-containing protein, MltF-like [Desulfonema limicola]
MKNLSLSQLQKNYLFIKIALILFLLCPLPSTAQELDKITEISIVTPQWDEQTNNDGTGLFFEIIKTVYEPAGIKMKYSFVPWKRAQMMVSSTQADAMVCVWKEHALEEKQLIPVYPMFIEYTAAVYKKETIKTWEGIKTLNDKNAVWLRGYDYHTSLYLKDINFKQRGEVDDYSQAWSLIDKGRYDVYIDALIDLHKYIRHNKLDMTSYSLEILWGEKAYPAFSNTEKSKKLIKIFETRIIELHKSGQLKQLYDKWHVKYPEEAWNN